MAGGHFLPRDLLERFDTTGPRYTSYPTALEWSDGFSTSSATALLDENQRTRGTLGLSLYTHVPFCQKLCWYCGCNMLVTRNAALVERYLDAVEREVALVAAHVDRRRPVVQLHWGGGTPTHLSPAQLERLFHAVTGPFTIAKDAELSIEVHPPVTSGEQLETLARLGFNRLSMGVQDFDPDVQQAVHRIQPFEQTAALVDKARALGFLSIGTDLMYGLPLQTPARFAATLELVERLRPDRIALFNYAHVPWLKPHQKLLKVAELPSRDDKITLLELAVNGLVDAGYRYIGLDHFALPGNELALAHEHGTLRRNFMGYTTCADSDLLAFGVSSITDLDGAYLQNARELDDYLAACEAGTLPVQRGLALSADDRLRRDVINALACNARVDKAEIGARHRVDFDTYFADALPQLAPLVEAGLVELPAGAIVVTARGQLLLRNVCMVFDAYLARSGGTRRFSRTL